MQIAVLDREGNELGRIGEAGQYFQPAFSPDGSKVLAMRRDPGSGTVDLWVFDVETGQGTQVTSTNDIDEETPVWAPDGEHIGYSYFHEDYSWIARRQADGSGDEELLFRYTPGAFIALMDFTEDGQYLSFDGGGYVVNVRLAGNDPFAREPIDLIREEFEVSVTRFSPDGRYVAYAYTESGRPEVYITGFDSATGMATDSERLQVSTDGTIGGISWRADGEELYFVNQNLDTADEFNDIKVMAVDVSTTPELSISEPRELFALTIVPAGNSAQWQNASADGERFLFVVAAE